MKKIKAEKSEQSSLKCEALEPRILLSAGAEALAVDSSIFQDDTDSEFQTEVVSLLNQTNLNNDTQSQDNLESTTELVIIDSSTPDYESLLADLENQSSSSLDILILDSSKDGIDQINTFLSDYNDIDALHFISHGSDGNISLGNTDLNFDSLSEYSDDLQNWQDRLSTDADILIYGCDVADTEYGQDFIDTLSVLTGADVAASDDLTGDTQQGGDWELEYQAGEIETDIVFSDTVQQNWSNVLADTTYESHATVDSDQEIKSDLSSAQTFSHTSGDGTYDVDRLSVELKKDVVAASQNITVSLRSTFGGADIASATISSDSLTTSYASYNFDFAATTLTDGTTYFIYITTDSTAGQVFVGHDGFNGYGSGSMYDKDGNALPGKDAAFAVSLKNIAPTAADKTVTMDEDSTYAFTASDFNFSDANTGDTLSSVKVTTLESAGSLTWFNGTSDVAVTLNQVITKADIDAGKLKFTPASNASGTGYATYGFSVNDGMDDSTSSYTMTLNVTAVGDTPTVANITTDEDTQSGAIVIDRNASDGAEVTHFKITNITNGSLYQNDGTTVINNGDYITYAQAQAGLKFTPTSNSNANGSFNVESSKDGSTVSNQGGAATSTITVTAIGDTPTVANITTNEDTQSGAIVIDRNANDGAEITHFKISGITNGTLYQNDGTTAISNGDYITYAQAQAGLKFSPTSNSSANGSFNVESSKDGSTVSNQGGAGTSTITVTAIGDTPTVANITTNEDTQSGAIVIDRNANDGAEITHFKISGITNGTLYQNDGTTVISDGDYITYAQAQAGLKFTPTSNSNTNGSFNVESSKDGSTVSNQGGAGTSTITVTAIGDTPTVANITTNEDTQTGAIVIDRNANDGAEVTHFKITNITNGTLYQNDGTTAISNGDYITYAQAQAGLKFTPTSNSNANGSFSVEASEDGSTVAAQSGAATSTITVTAVGDTPTVANITTNEDTQSGAIVIDRNANDGAEVTHFKITNITNGTLYQNDGTTVISNGDYITYAQAQAGLKFTPTSNSTANGSFDVQSSEDGTSVAAQSGTAATSTITVTAIGDTPTVANITTNEDTQSGAIVIDRNANDGAEVTHFKITNITNGTLYQNDGTTAISNGDYITYAQAQAGLKFTPTSNSNANGSFSVEASEDGSTVAAQSGAATSTITVTSIGDTPTVANITTNEDTQSGAIVIDRNANDGAEVTHFKITSITNGTLYQSDGTTVISNGDYITYAQAQAGLKFTPTSNSTANGSFNVESSKDGSTVSNQGSAATSSITVTAIGDTPTVANITTNEDTQSGAIIIDRNANDGAEVTHFKITSITNGTLYQNDGTTVISNGDYITYAQAQAGLKFTPTSNSTANGSFDVQSSEDGTSVAAQSGTAATSTITVTAIGDTPTVANITTNEDTQSGAIVIDRNANDGAEVTHFKITSITNGTLYQNDGTTVISNGDYITYAQAQAGLKFTPTSNSTANGSFDVQSSEDGSTVAAQSGTAATSTITVNAVNDAPTATDKTVNTTIDTTYTLTAADFNFNDVDGDSLTQVQISTLETAGALQLSGVDVALNDVISVADINAGNLKFVPGSGDSGAPYTTFQFKVHDGTTYSTASTLTVDVGANTAPTAANNTVTTNEDTAYTFVANDFNFSDADSHTLQQVKITTLESSGALQLDGVDVTLNQVVSIADINAGKLKFVSAANANGSGYDNFGFQVSDGIEFSASAYTMTVDVTAVNDAPTAANQTVTTNEDTTHVFSSADFNFSDVDGNAFSSVKVTSLESVGSLTWFNGASDVAVTTNQVITKADIDAGKLKFVPLANGNGAGYDSFSFSVSDGATDSASSYTMTVDVTAVNDAPTAANKTVTTNEDTTYTFVASDFNFSDVDGDTLSQLQITALESSGSLKLSGIDIALNDIVTLADINSGFLTFTPATNANGTGYDSFNFKVHDGVAYSASSYSVTVDVTAVNDAPVATTDSVTGNEDTAITINAATDLLANDTDIDGDTLSIASFTQPANGSMSNNGDGTYTYTPTANFNGTDSFTYTVSDGKGGSDSVSVNITVNSINDIPLVSDQSYTLSSIDNGTVVGSYTATDPDSGDTLTYSIVGGPDNAGLSLNSATGEISISDSGLINKGQSALTFIVQADDGNGGITSSQVTISLFLPAEEPTPIPVEPIREEIVEPIVEEVEVTTDAVEAVEDILETDEEESTISNAVVDESNSNKKVKKDVSTDDETGEQLEPTENEAESNVDLMQINNEGFDEDERTAYAQSKTYLGNLKFDQIEDYKVDAKTEKTISKIRQHLEKSFEEGEKKQELVIASIQGTGLSLTVGFAAYALRGGALLTSMMSSMPMWYHFDPLPLLAGAKEATDIADNTGTLDKVEDLFNSLKLK